MADGFAIGISLAAVFLSIIAMFVAGWAMMDVWAFRRSTHQVQFVSADQEKAEMEEDRAINRALSQGEMRAMREAFGNDREVDQ
jgi:hypothetical protein